MKKITKLFGLLLVAGAMLVGCKMEPNIDTNEIVLANGNWEMEESGVYTATSPLGTETSNVTLKGTFSVSGDEITFLSLSQSSIETFTFSESATAAEVQAKKTSAEALAGKNGGTVTVDGKTITITIPMRVATEDELANMNKGKNAISDLNKDCVEYGGVIKRNKKKTEYNISYTVSSNGVTETYTYNLKKQK